MGTGCAPIQLYLVERLFASSPSLEHFSRTDVIREYLSEFLFRSKYGEAKEDITWKIFGIMDAWGDPLPVSKNALKEQLPVHLKREAAPVAEDGNEGEERNIGNDNGDHQISSLMNRDSTTSIYFSFI